VNQKENNFYYPPQLIAEIVRV